MLNYLPSKRYLATTAAFMLFRAPSLTDNDTHSSCRVTRDVTVRVKLQIDSFEFEYLGAAVGSPEYMGHFGEV
jgi:hypothetical protein